ncbi:hypothetical protein ACC771_14435, partial [Rhizobium ruizarguesonis]
MGLAGTGHDVSRRKARLVLRAFRMRLSQARMLLGGDATGRQGKARHPQHRSLEDASASMDGCRILAVVQLLRQLGKQSVAAGVQLNE